MKLPDARANVRRDFLSQHRAILIFGMKAPPWLGGARITLLLTNASFRRVSHSNALKHHGSVSPARGAKLIKHLALSVLAKQLIWTASGQQLGGRW